MAIRKVISRSVQDTTGVDILLDTAAPTYHSVDPSLNLDFVNTKTMDPRVAFTRGSNATYYDGTSVLAEQNFLVRSQDWSASWGLNSSATTVTANSTAAPDGTTTATQFSIARTTSELHYSEQSVNSLGGPVTVSAYFKANTHNFLTLAVYQAGFGNAYSVAFNLSTGAITKTTSAGSVFGVSSGISSIGNSWYRVTVTATFPSIAPTYMIFATNSVSVPTYNYQGILESYAGTVGNSFYVWGAQMENRSSPTAYTPTTTTVASTYIPALKTAGPNQPRFDVDPVTKESKGFLVEEQRTNIFTYSNLGDNSVLASNWSVGTGSRDFGAVVGPDGTLSARRLCSLAAGNSYFSRNQNISIGSTGTYVFSIWARLIAGSTPTQLSGYFSTYAQGVTMNAAPSTNQWTRFYGTVTFATTGTTNFTLPWYDSPNGTIIDYFGPQLEMGTFPTSYIPTPHGSSVTRAADFAEIGGTNFDNFFNNQTGTAYFEGSIFAVNPNYLQGAFAFTRDTGNDNVIDLRMQQPGYGNLHVTYGHGATQAQIAGGTTQAINTTAKFGIAYGSNDVAFYKNGVSIGTDNNVIVPQNLTKLEIGKADQSANKVLNGYVRKFSYYPVRLTNAEIVNLTT